MLPSSIRASSIHRRVGSDSAANTGPTSSLKRAPLPRTPPATAAGTTGPLAHDDPRAARHGVDRDLNSGGPAVVLRPPPDQPVGGADLLDFHVPALLAQPLHSPVLVDERIQTSSGDASTSISLRTGIDPPLTTRWLLLSFDNQPVVERIAMPLDPDGRRAELARGALVRHLLPPAERADRVRGTPSTTRSRTSSSHSSCTSRARTPTRTSRSTSTPPAASSTQGSRSTTRCSSSSRPCRRSASAWP